MSQDVDIFVLNFNGGALLRRCLPSIARERARSGPSYRLVVVDNSSTDDSVAWLAANHPRVPVLRRPNRGLCSFNDVLRESTAPVAVLLNNDLELWPGFLEALTAPLRQGVGNAPARTPPCFLTAARLCRPDGGYDGQKTAVAWRWGLVQATSLFTGHRSGMASAGLTASAGAAIAVDRRRFVELGGFSELYLPGRLEDLDLAYRAFLAGWECRYVPEAMATHLGHATYDRELGTAASHALALRNTLLFQWRHLRRPEHLAAQAIGGLVRISRDFVRAPFVDGAERWPFVRAVRAALQQWAAAPRREPGRRPSLARRWQREREFFRRYHPRAMTRTGAAASWTAERPAMEAAA